MLLLQHKVTGYFIGYLTGYNEAYTLMRDVKVGTGCLQRKEGEARMRRLSLAMLVFTVLAGLLTGCQGKKPVPGDIAGYDEGEQYLSIWVHSIEDTDEGKCYRDRKNLIRSIMVFILRILNLSQEMTVAAVTLIRLMRPLCLGICRMS